jgi:hypothetical protein
MSYTAADVMDQAAAILNDVGKSLYTYAYQLPYLKKSHEELEQHLIIWGAPMTRKPSSAIAVAAGAVTLTLPTDFLLPIRLFERASGGSNSDWLPITEREWEPEAYVQVNTLSFWAFRDNAINFPGALVATEVKLEYERRLGVIATSGDLEDFTLAKTWLAARTAELCARYIGMNADIADGIKMNDTDKAEDSLSRSIVLNSQGVRHRRRKFSS